MILREVCPGDNNNLLNTITCRRKRPDADGADGNTYNLTHPAYSQNDNNIVSAAQYHCSQSQHILRTRARRLIIPSEPSKCVKCILVDINYETNFQNEKVFRYQF